MNTKHTPAPWTVNPKAKTNIRHGNLTIANCSSTHDGSREEYLDNLIKKNHE